MTRGQSAAVYGLIIAQLEAEGKKARERADACDRALKALTNGTAPKRVAKAKKVAKKARHSHISPAGLKAIKAAQKARWAKFHKQQAEV